MRFCPALLLLLTGLLSSSATAQVHHVSALARAGGDGSSWGQAFQALQPALAVAVPGDQIWIAEGTYFPDLGLGVTPGDRTATFDIPSGVELYGGFLGSETALEGRLGLARNTILSGDLSRDDVPGFANHGENAYHVVTVGSVSAATRLDSLTISGGNANDVSAEASGGGLLIELGSELLMTSCIVRHNAAVEDGGGVLHTSNSNARFEDCVFEENFAWRDGGAVMCITSSSPEFVRCVFDRNSANRWGGAARNMQAALPRYTECLFQENDAADSAGALWNDNAGITIEDCQFVRNQATNLGGALLSTGGPLVMDSIFRDNVANRGGALYVLGIFSRPAFEACTFIGNLGSTEGGAVYNGGKPTFTDCRFEANTTPTDGGALCSKGSGPEIEARGCQFVDNEANRGGAVYNSGVGVGVYVDCTFEQNLAQEWGGAMYHGEAQLEITDCVFDDNVSLLKGGGLFLANLVATATIKGCDFLNCNAQNVGGALYITNNASPVVEDCRFENNFARIHGAGVYNTSSEGAGGESSGTFRRCIFSFNSSPEDGAAFFNTTSVQGGTCSPSLIDCRFDRNLSAKDGGAFYNIAFGGTSAPELTNVQFIGNLCGKNGAAFHNTATSRTPNTFCQPRFQSCVFSGNVANFRGGAFYNDNRSTQPGNSDAVFSNCVMSRNSAAADGGGVFNWHTRVGQADLTFRNTILWENTDVGGTDESAQFFNYIGEPTVEYCCIQGWSQGGPGNVAVDPLFVDALGADGIAGTLDDNLRLSTASPMIDAGDNNGVLADAFDLDGDMDFLEATPLDVDGAVRFFDSTATDTGVGNSPIVDLGAFEAVDCDSNGINDAEDVALGAPDCNGNHIPDLCDIDRASGGTCTTICSTDCNLNGIPDECEADCNGNGYPDECELARMGGDCNLNGVPDACDLSSGSSLDLDGNGIPDECEG